MADATGLSRRRVDELITKGQIRVNNREAVLGDNVGPTDKVTLGGKIVSTGENKTLLILNKPAGYVSSRNGQGSSTVYDLLPKQYRRLKIVGRLDKDSSGLLLLTDDGALANLLTHPRYSKEKIYSVSLDKIIDKSDIHKIEEGVLLSDGISKFKIERMTSSNQLKVTLREGRNRQIRRTFARVGYKVTSLHRVAIGKYTLDNLAPGEFKKVDVKS